VMLGLGAAADALAGAFGAAAKSPIVKGFAIGRTIFGQAAQDWFAGRIDDEAAIADMARRYGALVDAWSKAKGLNLGLELGA
jgi:5-dehydro-2-deoxygluconokinase